MNERSHLRDFSSPGFVCSTIVACLFHQNPFRLFKNVQNCMELTCSVAKLIFWFRISGNLFYASLYVSSTSPINLNQIEKLKHQFSSQFSSNYFSATSSPASVYVLPSISRLSSSSSSDPSDSGFHKFATYGFHKFLLNIMQKHSN